MKLPHPNLLIILNVKVLYMTTLPVIFAHTYAYRYIQRWIIIFILKSFYYESNLGKEAS